MAKIKTFKQLLVWQKAHQLTLEVYNATRSFPKYEQFGLIFQMRRCVVSIPSNIAEGFKRKSLKDSLHFYNIAESSLEELKYQLLLAKDLNYINEQIYNKLFTLAEEVGKLLNGWKKSQR
jgi:four helix bundle protein